jgi:hypothetical protein
MKECSRRRRADAPQRWTNSVPNKPGRMKRRLLNLPLMKGLLDVLSVDLSPPLLHPLPSFCRKPSRRTKPPDEVCELGELVHLLEPPVGRCSPLRGLHFSSNTNSFSSETASVASSCAPSVVQKVCCTQSAKATAHSVRASLPPIRQVPTTMSGKT